jgi:hypothetical protein
MEDLVASGPLAVKKKHNSVSSSSAGQAGGSMQQSQTQDASTCQQDEVDTTATVNQQPSPGAVTCTRLRPRKPAPVKQDCADESADSDDLGEGARPTKLQQQGLAATPEAAVSLQPAAGAGSAQQLPTTLLDQLLQMHGSAAAAGTTPGQPALFNSC